MTPRQIELARHALGLDGRRKVSYRNHFVTGPGPDSDDYPQWVAMTEAGYATHRTGGQFSGGDDLFMLTPAGARAALNGDERLDPEDFRDVTP